MIVCICHAVSESDLRDLALEGASEDEVVRLTRAGTACGMCVSTVRSVVSSQRPPCGKAVPCAGCECIGAPEPETSREAA